MKVYNIRNTHEFFEKLSGSKGIVELVDKNGVRLPLTAGNGKTAQFPFPQIYGEIDELELCFQYGEDCRRILTYMLNRRNKTIA